MSEIKQPVQADGPAEVRTGRPASRSKILLIVLKLVISIGCLILVALQLDTKVVRRVLSELDVFWCLLAVALIAAEIPIVGERWRLIVMSLGHGMYSLPARDVQAANGIGQFLGQILPNIAGDGARDLLLRTHWVTLAHAAWSVLLDRAVGVYVLFVVALLALLLPSGFNTVQNHHGLILFALGSVVAVGTLVLILSAPVGRWLEKVGGGVRFIGTALRETHRAILGPKSRAVFLMSLVVHGLTVLTVYVLVRAIKLPTPMPLTDAAVLMAYMMVVTLLPISIGGWGVREFAVSSLLTAHGASTEEAVVFSVAFGLVVAVATLPGAIFWLFSRGRTETSG